jgi:hypothetical protein
MQSDSCSQSPSPGPEEFPSSPTDTFAFTRDDTRILEEYADQFEDGSAALRTTIVARAMAELYGLRPGTAPFNKDEVGKVCTAGHHTCI